MIVTSELEYRVTREKAALFRRGIKQFETRKHLRTNVHPLLLQSERAGMEFLLARLEKQAAEYRQLKTAEKPVVRVRTFEEVAEALAAARIASGLTQKQLAQKTGAGLTEEQVRQYEESRYKEASFPHMLSVANALRLEVEMTISVPRQAPPAAETGEAAMSKVAEG